MFSRTDFDVSCAKSAQLGIRLWEDKPFQKNTRRVPLSDLEDLRDQLAKLKKATIIHALQQHCKLGHWLLSLRTDVWKRSLVTS